MGWPLVYDDWNYPTEYTLYLQRMLDGYYKELESYQGKELIQTIEMGLFYGLTLVPWRGYVKWV